MNHDTKIARLEKQLAKAIAEKVKADAQRFKKLVVEWGYAGATEFFELVYGYAKAAKATKAAKKPKATKRKNRAVINDTLRAAIVADTKAGKLTGGQIAKKHGVSLPSVQNIKKPAGLVTKT